jgi:hypothetical protein
MEPIRSFYAVCRSNSLTPLQADTLQSLVDQRRGTIHPYWIQLALNMPYDFAKRLHDELIANEWASPDEVLIEGMCYETQLTEDEIEILAKIELSL